MSSRGFSLLELLVVMALMAMTAAFTIPAYQHFFQRSTTEILSARLLRAMTMARHEALSRGVVVTLCKSRDHTTCSGDWRDGQILFVDDNENGIVTDRAQVLFVFDQSYPGVLHWRSALHRDYVQMLPTGATENGTFWYCPRAAHHPAWEIILNRSGRARLVSADSVQGDFLC